MLFRVMINFVLLLLLLHPDSMAAAGLPAGWTLTEMREEAPEENTYPSASLFFSLRPPDGRPPVTIDARTAARVRSGELNAETAYGGQGTNAKGQGESGEDFVYGARYSIVVAEPVNSTLTLEDGRKDLVSETASAQPSLGSSSFLGLGGPGKNPGVTQGLRETSPAESVGRNPSASNPTSLAQPSSASRASASSAPPSMLRPQVKENSPNIQAAAQSDPKRAALVGSLNFANPALVPKEQERSAEKEKNRPGENPISEPAKSKCDNAKASIFDKPGTTRLPLPGGCRGLRVHAWGAGGGGAVVGADNRASGGEGGGGAYVYNEGEIDPDKYELVVVVGGAGGDGKSNSAGAPGYSGGGSGGAKGGGGGGGFSGLFLADKIRSKPDDASLFVELAVVVAAGGGGGSATGDQGGPGGTTKADGPLGGTGGAGGEGTGNGKKGGLFHGGDGGDGSIVLGGGGGGGGGAGYFGGGGGGGLLSEGGSASAGGGGTSFIRFVHSSYTMMGAKKSTAGNGGASDREGAGDARKPGRVILEFF